MPIIYKKNKAIFNEIIGVEEAEGLLEWLHQNPRGKIDLGSCTHLHAADLQVLMAAKNLISVQPVDISLAAWLVSTDIY